MKLLVYNSARKCNKTWLFWDVVFLNLKAVINLVQCRRMMCNKRVRGWTMTDGSGDKFRQGQNWGLNDYNITYKPQIPPLSPNLRGPLTSPAALERYSNVTSAMAVVMAIISSVVDQRSVVKVYVPSRWACRNTGAEGDLLRMTFWGWPSTMYPLGGCWMIDTSEFWNDEGHILRRLMSFFGPW